MHKFLNQTILNLHIVSKIVRMYSHFMQQYYIPTARELARISEIQKSPILHHFGESLSGAATIRAFDQKDRFVDANLILVDRFSKPWFHNVSAMEWLSFRLNQLSNFVFAFSLVLLVSLPDGIISASKSPRDCNTFHFSPSFLLCYISLILINTFSLNFSCIHTI